MGALVVLVLFLVVVWCVLGAVGAWLAEQRRRPRGVGFAFGFFLGPLGLVIVALLPYGPETPQMPIYRPRPTRAGALYGPAPTSPQQPEWKSQRQWRDLESAAGSLPEKVRDEAQTLSTKVLHHLGHTSGLRASLFVREKNQRISIDLLCDETLIVASLAPGQSIPSTSYAHASNYNGPGQALSVVARHRAGADGFEISFDSRAAGSRAEVAHWAEVLSDQATLEHFCSEAGTRHWINVVGPVPAVASQMPTTPTALETTAAQASVVVRLKPESVSEAPAGASDDLNEVRQKLTTLKELRDQNLISEEEYAERRRAILDTIV